MVRVWLLDETSTADQKEPLMTNPPQFIDINDLRNVGLKYWKLNCETYMNDGILDAIRKEGHYDYEDEVTLSRGNLATIDEMLDMFFTEHIHADDEIRFIRDGTGYFDVRDASNKWFRIEAVKGDMIAIPAGLYHRFTLDSKNYIYANRYFSGSPDWTAFYRPQEEHPVPIAYVSKYLTPQVLSSV